MNQPEIDRLFDSHDPDPDQALAHTSIRESFKTLAKSLSNLPNGRERSLALTKLEEASFWAHAAIARPPS